MTSNEIENINLLGHKRKQDSIVPSDEYRAEEEEEKQKEVNSQKFLLKKPEFYESFSEDKNGNSLNISEEKNESQIEVAKFKIENVLDKKICQKCKSQTNVLSFHNSKSILDFLSQKRILVSKNAYSGENLNFDSPKTICLNCLLKMSKNRTEFENFVELNNLKKNDDKDNPFNNLFNVSILKNFNNIETKKNKSKSKSKTNSKLSETEAKIRSSLNTPSINNNNYNNYNNRNINLDYLNALNYTYLPSINYNMPFNQNIANLNIPNYHSNDFSNFFSVNNYMKTPEIKDNNINQTNQMQNPLLNYQDIFDNSLLKKSIGLFNPSNAGLLNLYPMPIINNNSSFDIQSENMPSNINGKNGKEKVQKNSNEMAEKNNTSKNYTMIPNKDFDEIFELTSRLYHKLLDIKMGRDLNLDTKSIIKKVNEILATNNSNFLNNDLNDNNILNLDSNQLRNINLLNEKDFKYNMNNSNNNIYSNQNTVYNHIKIGDNGNSLKANPNNKN